MTPHSIRADLISRGVTEVAIAREVGVHRSLVCHVIARRRGTPKVQKAIARRIGRRLHEVFPVLRKAA